MLSRWDARTEPLVDPMAGSATIAIRAPASQPAPPFVAPRISRSAISPRSRILPPDAPDLFPGTVPQIVALDADPDTIPAMVGNLRAAGLTGPPYENSIVIGQHDVRGLTPDDIERRLPAVRDMRPGVFCFNPPYGVRIGAEHGEEKLLALYSDMGRALARFRGWRAACFVANPHFVAAFGHPPTMTKPASNANLRGWFFVFQL